MKVRNLHDFAREPVEDYVPDGGIWKDLKFLRRANAIYKFPILGVIAAIQFLKVVQFIN